VPPIHFRQFLGRGFIIDIAQLMPGMMELVTVVLDRLFVIVHILT
jgi:hypothetical protein